MKKLLLLALVLTVTGCAPSASPSGSPSPAASASAQERRGFNGQRLQEELGLTEQQVAELKPLFEKQRQDARERGDRLRSKMAQVLTPEQLEKLAKLEGEGERHGRNRRRTPYEKLDLTGEQASLLEQLRQQNREDTAKDREAFFQELATKLTPEQQAKLKQFQEKRKERESD